MARRRSYTPEQIITNLREAEIYLSQGKTVKEASKLLADQRADLVSLAQRIWGLDVTQAKKLKPQRSFGKGSAQT